MPNTNKISFYSILALIFLLPVFFLPATVVPLGTGKALLLTVGVLLAFITFALTVLRRGGFTFPSHYIMWTVIVLPSVYVASALLSATRDIALFGYRMEVGTAVYMVLASVLFGLVATVFTDSTKIARAISALFLSLGLLTLFALVKVFTGVPVWDTFGGRMGNPIGAWTDYGVIFGLLATLSALALGVLALKGALRVFMYGLFVASLFLMAVANFSTAFWLTLIASVVMLVYLLTIEKQVGPTGQEQTHGTYTGSKVWPAGVLCALSLIFVINPTVSATHGTIGETVGGAFGIENLDVRPSFLATLGISQSVFKESPLLGSGPNTFNQNWLKHKDKEINDSIFWNTAFPSGFGFVPTQASSVGVLGSVAWILFFATFLLLGVKALARVPHSNWDRFMVISTFLGAFFLWLSSFMYTPSMVVMTVAFILTGLFLASARASGIVGERTFSMSNNMVLNFTSVLVLVALGIGSITLGFSVYQRTASAYHFQKAVILSGTEGSSVDAIQGELVKAIRLVPSDSYYSALSEVSIARAQSALNATEGTQEENTRVFQEALSNGIAAAQSATKANPQNYRNWVMLGTIYSSLVPEPFEVEGAYESAESALEEARKRNPNSPEVPVLLARLELDNGNSETARAYISESIALKQDYADAYFLLTQLEITENNIPGAIRSAETSAILQPDNAGLFFQLGLLRYQNENYTQAVSAFNQALRIIPEYANARYFLGLSLAQLERTEEAIAQFENLARTNPENEEVATILTNLKDGKDALEGIPKESTSVETRETPPITEVEE